MDSLLDNDIAGAFPSLMEPRTACAIQKNAIIVLGMHRSGTSALTRVLNLLGVEIGHDLMPATPDNTKGYFELSAVSDLDDQIFADLGSSWDDVKPLPAAWWENPNIVGYRRQLLDLLQQQIGDGRLWGLKDPRICRLLPLWRSVIRDTGANPHYVVIARHPLEVVQSLQKRDAMSISHALMLWLRYVLDAERNSRGSQRVFVTYDQLMSEWPRVVDNLEQNLQLRFPVQRSAARNEIEDFLSPQLRHHSVKQGAVVSDSIFRSCAEALYEAVCKASSGQDFDSALFDQVSGELGEVSRLYQGRPVVVEPEKSVSDVKIPDQEECYQTWMNKTALTESDGQYMAERMMQNWQHRPGIHVIVPLFPGSEHYLADTLDSLARQLYGEWGLTVVTNMPAPDHAFTEQPMLEWVVTSESVASSVNSIIQRSPADWIILMTPGTQLAPQALFSIADYANLNSGWRVIYCDEDRLDENGDRCEPSFKPDMNLDLLHSAPYIGEAVFFHRETVLALSGFADYRGQENYELLFRFIERFGTNNVGHVADVLLHIPKVPVSDEEASFLDRQGRQIVEAHLRRNGDDAEVLGGFLPNTYRVVYKQADLPLVSIIIPSKDRLELLEPCIDSLLGKTLYPNFEILIVDNGSTAIDTHEYYEELQSRQADKIRILSCPGEFNYSAMNNLAVAEARGEYLLLLNNDTQVVQDEWLDRMMHHGQRPEVGIVGPRLIYPNGSLQHVGVILGLGEAADHIGNGQSLEEPGYLNRYQVDQELSAVTGACLLIRKSVYLAVNGLDAEELKVCFNDIDLCLKVTEQGYKVIWTPFSTLVHHGSATQLANVSPDKFARFKGEQDVMRRRWLKRLAHDPAYNDNLSMLFTDGRAETQILPRWDVNFHDRTRIAGFPLDYFGCGQYRIIAPLTALDRAGLAQCALMPKMEVVGKLPRIPTSIEIERMSPDVLFLQSSLSDEYLQALALYKRHNKAFRVFELDDLKCKVPEKNSRRKFLYRDMKQRLQKGLALCDRLIVTTEPLAEAMHPYIDDIRIIPNYLEGSRWSSLRSQRHCGRLPRVGWAGAQQHHGDLEFLIEVVKATAGKVEWVFFGMCLEELRPYAAEVHDFVDFESYPQKLSSLNLDLAVAPLEYHPFNEAKSNLRLLEYGIMGWPVICTDIFPYQNAPVVRLANETRPWIEAILERAYDLDSAAKEGDRLQQWVRGNWMLEDHLQDWLAALSPHQSDVQRRAAG